MSHLITNWLSLLCPWLLLMRCLQVVADCCGTSRRGLGRLIVSGLVSVGLLAVPIKGFTIGWWVRGIETNFSIPFTMLLVAAVWEGEFSRNLLRPGDVLAGWIFGVAAGLMLYPFALGWGNFDPYEWGWWFSPLFVAGAALTALLIWRQNRFGVVLLLAVVAYHLHLLESPNYWDYLVDPMYFVAGAVALGFWVLLTKVRLGVADARY